MSKKTVYMVLANISGDVQAVGMINGLQRLVPVYSEYVLTTTDYLAARTWARWAVTYGGARDTKTVVTRER